MAKASVFLRSVEESIGAVKLCCTNEVMCSTAKTGHRDQADLERRRKFPLVDAVDPNLQPFQARGGKLIMYHGFSDPDISPTNSINYFDSVVATQRPGRGNGIGEDRVALRRTQEFLRLFMIPGMNHCAGGPGTDQFDMVTALEKWVEQGTAPDSILASHVANGGVTFTRPLCPYPQLASYTGSGNPNDASNFVCAEDEDTQPAQSKGH